MNVQATDVIEGLTKEVGKLIQEKIVKDLVIEDLQAKVEQLEEQLKSK